jgi:mannan polymerase II complex ANP1 subunit
MAKRMQFSVVGLPHYTIWHLYEPSVDDIRHMEVRGSIIFLGNNLLTLDRKWSKSARLVSKKKRTELSG